jgi:hypothetical protein
MTRIQIEIGVKIKEIMVGAGHDLESGINLPHFESNRNFKIPRVLPKCHAIMKHR